MSLASRFVGGGLLTSRLNVVCLTFLTNKLSTSSCTLSKKCDIPTDYSGLDGYSPCVTKSIAGPEPNYASLRKTHGFKLFKNKQRFELKVNQGVLPEFQLAYETWGALNAEKSNAILLFTGLSADSHAKSNEETSVSGWWEDFIGSGCAIDTDKFFVICCNHIGSCFGSTGPSSKNPLTGKPYASTFPIISVSDMVRAQFKLIDHLGIDKLHATIGSSLGGMCSLLSGLEHSQRVQRIISISACAQATPSSIAMRYLQRKAIMLDPHWNNGFYYDQVSETADEETKKAKLPINGIRLAREIATMTYRSGPEWLIRFGRKKINEADKITLCPTFEIENYLSYNGDSFSTRYDPNSLLYLSKAMDLFDLSEGYDSMEAAFAKITCPTMIMGAQTDILFPVTQQREIAKYLKDSGNNSVVYYEIDSLFGHDTFLLNLNDCGTAIKGFLETRLAKTGELSKSKC